MAAAILFRRRLKLIRAAGPPTDGVRGGRRGLVHAEPFFERADAGLDRGFQTGTAADGGWRDVAAPRAHALAPRHDGLAVHVQQESRELVPLLVVEMVVMVVVVMVTARVGGEGRAACGGAADGQDG